MLRISQNCTKSSNHGRKSYDENAGFEGRAVPDVVWSGPTFNPRALHGARPGQGLRLRRKSCLFAIF